MTTITNDIRTDHHATFSDLSRKYAPLIVRGGDILNALVKRSGTTNRGTRRDMPWSLLEAAYEGSIPTTMEGDKSINDANDVPTTSGKKTTGAFSGTGRRVGSVDVDDHEIIDNSMPSDELPGAALLLAGTETESVMDECTIVLVSMLQNFRGEHYAHVSKPIINAIH